MDRQFHSAMAIFFCFGSCATLTLALKRLAALDDQFSAAGMQFVKGWPTYKLLPRILGESFAIAMMELSQTSSAGHWLGQ
jgi:hypothetical protein